MRSKTSSSLRSSASLVALFVATLLAAVPSLDVRAATTDATTRVVSRGVGTTPARGAGVVAPGRKAPAFVVERPDGTELSSKRFAGRPYLINVFAAWCGSCRVEEPLLIDAFAKYKDRVAFLGIDEQEGVARAVAFARELRVPFPIAIDEGPFAASYDTSKIPQTILVDRRGIVRAVFRGLISSEILESSLARIAKKD